MLYRVIYVSETALPTGLSTAMLADIVGTAAANNRRDDITSGLMMDGTHLIQVIEGGQPDVERLMRRIQADGRHRNLRIVSAGAVSHRRLTQPLCLRHEGAALLALAGVTGLEQIGANDAERMLSLRLAA